MTTNSLHNAFVNALLADASYVDNLNPSTSLVAALGPRLTPTLAKYLSDNFEVVTQKLTNDLTESGFDATVWRGKANTPDAGKVYVSMRGTEFSGPADLAADIDLTAGGLARLQVVDMVNWWLKSTTPATALAAQVKYVTPLDLTLIAAGNSVGSIVAAPPVQGDGSIPDAISITVNGHSLGGHLATAFSRIFGSNTNLIDHTYTFNSANFNPLSSAKFAQIATALGTGATAFPSNANDTNFYAKNGPDATAQNLTGGQIGLRVPLFNEETPFADFVTVPNHYMYKLTDALALGNAFELLDATLTTDKFNALFDAGSNKTAASIEGVLDGLRRIVLGSSVAATQIGDVSDSANSRIDFHTNLKDLTDGNAFKALKGIVTITLPDSTLSTKAKTDFAAFLSLNALSPVVISTSDSTAIAKLKQANQTLAQQWDADSQLTAAQRERGQANITDVYLLDRQAMLLGLTSQNIDDKSRDTALPGKVNANYTYTDFASGQAIKFKGTASNAIAQESQQVMFGDDTDNALVGSDASAAGLGDHLYGGAGDDFISGKASDDYLEGNSGNDTLDGGEGADTLLGGADDDTLNGGDSVKAADTLVGGVGTDTYQFTGKFGNDTVIDAGGQGSIVLDGTVNVWGWEKEKEHALKTPSTTQYIATIACNTPALACLSAKKRYKRTLPARTNRSNKVNDV